MAGSRLAWQRCGALASLSLHCIHRSLILNAIEDNRDGHGVDPLPYLDFKYGDSV